MTPLVSAKWRWWIVALLCLWLFIGLARQAKAEGLLGDIESLQGSFTQEISNAQGTVTAQSRGVFALLRPHFFMWEITAPGKQRLISDGEFFWQYDKDLSTVIRRPLKEQLNSPLGVLLVADKALQKRYKLTRSATEITLKPLESNPMFTSMQVTLNQGVPVAVLVTDNLDQSIRFKLSPDNSALLTPADFVFDPPSDADITIVKP
ncbi:outer membrane lipoprotein chaperone LolA [Luminiphilus sp.]|nr:outer membrane lipoprotein chaperone LolA [Luminiphilus sp.]